jgi:peptidoglycan/LPS O-acetylase OafA/YrhL
VHTPRLIAPLTSLRGLAAIGVAGFHFFYSMLQTAQFARGYLGVDLFFLLSGFILFHVYHADLSPRAFFAARIARTWPLHLFVLLLLLPAFGRSEAFSATALLCNLTMTQAVCGVSSSWNGVSWSLSAEWFAYLLFPLLLPWLRGCSSRGAWTIALVCLAALAAQGNSLLAIFGPLALARSLPEFVLGILTYRAYQGGWLGGWPWFTVACASIALSFEFGAPDWLIVAQFPIVLLSGPGVQPLTWRPFVFLGEISFSLYMIHQLIGLVVINVLPHNTTRSVLVGAIVSLVLSIGCSALIYRTIEVPARSFLRSRLAHDISTRTVQ